MEQALGFRFGSMWGLFIPLRSNLFFCVTAELIYCRQLAVILIDIHTVLLPVLRFKAAPWTATA